LHRNCLLKHIIEGRIQVMGRWGRRCKQLLDDHKETSRDWKLQEEAVYCTLWKNHFGRGYGPIVRQTTESTTHSIGGWVGPRTGLHILEKDIAWPHRDLNPDRPALSPVTILTTLSQFCKYYSTLKMGNSSTWGYHSRKCHGTLSLKYPVIAEQSWREGQRRSKGRRGYDNDIWVEFQVFNF
jgi:hypothetical protein